MALPSPFAPLPAAALAAGVRVQAPGRLHLGFLDPDGLLGRRFGSLGLAIEGYATELALAPAAADRFEAGADVPPAELQRAVEHLGVMRQRTGLAGPLALRLQRALPSHAGFGSGTQLALATGAAFAALHGLALDARTLAQWLGRGLRSGIGIAAFEQGGLLLDGGTVRAGEPAPLLSRLALPADWRVLVVLDPQARGLSGGAERRALAELPPFTQAPELCHQMLMNVLPGAASGDFASFATGVSRVQQLLGAHFAPAQGGSAYTSAAVGRLMQWIGSATTAAIGQSSWGPTGFAVLPSAAAADALLARLRAEHAADPALTLHVVAARQAGALIHPLTPAGAG